MLVPQHSPVRRPHPSACLVTAALVKVAGVDAGALGAGAGAGRGAGGVTDVLGILPAGWGQGAEGRGRSAHCIPYRHHHQRRQSTVRTLHSLASCTHSRQHWSLSSGFTLAQVEPRGGGQVESYLFCSALLQGEGADCRWDGLVWERVSNGHRQPLFGFNQVLTQHSTGQSRPG